MVVLLPPVVVVAAVWGEMVLLSLEPEVPGLMPVVLWLVLGPRSLGLGRPFGMLCGLLEELWLRRPFML